MVYSVHGSMNSLNLSLAVTGAFADVISPRYENQQDMDEEVPFHGKFHIIPKDRPIILLVMCMSCAFGGRNSGLLLALNEAPRNIL